MVGFGGAAMSDIEVEARRILFLCTGNYDKSRHAEILFNLCAGIHDLPWFAFSRGLAVTSRGRGVISPVVLTRISDLDLALVEELRPPTQATEEDLLVADVVVALDEVEHRPMVEDRFPTWAEHVRYWDVADLAYRSPSSALPAIERHVAELVGELILESDTGLLTGWPAETSVAV